MKTNSSTSSLIPGGFGLELTFKVQILKMECRSRDIRTILHLFLDEKKLDVQEVIFPGQGYFTFLVKL